MSILQDFAENLNIPLGVLEVAVSTALLIITLVVIYLIGRLLLLPALDRMLTSRDVERHARQPLLKVAWMLVIATAIVVAVSVAGFGDLLRSLATIAAAATLAVGFALQNVIRNFAAGVFIFIDRPFKIGDWIEWDDNVGVVQDISLRVTRVKTFNNELLTVPNSELTENVVKNPVAFHTLRLQPTFGIGYDDDIHEATSIILDEAADHEDILEDPAPSVRLVELGDSSIGLQSRIWIANPSRSDFTKIRGEFVTAVKEAFDAADIDIPYPQRELSGGVTFEEP